MPKLSRGEFITIAAVLLTAALSVVGHIFVREWYRADLRYEAGEYYRTSTSWITALRLQNYGREPAERVAISAAFPAPLREFSVGPLGVDLAPQWEGPGSTAITLTTESVAPGQSFYIYFEIEPPAGYGSQELSDYRTLVVSSAGIAHEGPPQQTTLPLLTYVPISMLFAALAGWLFATAAARPIRNDMDEVEARVDELGFTHETVRNLMAYVESLHDQDEAPPQELVDILKRHGMKIDQLRETRDS